MKKIFLFLTCACALLGCKHSLSSREIRLNQVGFAPQQEKTATIDVCTPDAAPVGGFPSRGEAAAGGAQTPARTLCTLL